MTILNLLEYQKIDGQLIKIERELMSSDKKKKCDESKMIAKKEQEKSTILEKNAGALKDEINEVIEKLNQNKKSKEMLLSKEKNIDNMTEEEIDNLLKLKDKINNNFNVLEKILTKLAERVNGLLSDFNKAKKAYEKARDDYSKNKVLYDNEVKSLEPKQEELKSQLAQLAKVIDKDLMEAYSKRRHDRIFPVLVTLNGDACGGCHMEISKAAISELKEKGKLTCENCKRIIYFTK